MDDSLQPTIDMLLNLSMFMWFGAVCPWSEFLRNDIIPLYRLVFLGILILLVRRLPIILAMHKYIHQIEHLTHAGFVGFFGPIGVGAIFYLSICRENLLEIVVDGEVREDAQRVADAAKIVVWFLVVCSIVVHGLSIPIGKAGYHLPRTLSQAISTQSKDDSVNVSNSAGTHSTATPLTENTQWRQNTRRRAQQRENTPNSTVFRLGGSVIRTGSPSSQAQPGTGMHDEPARPVNVITHDQVSAPVTDESS
ncbi:hypothetical protein N7470_000544 [Penicillium chermesinum]|nr:hypothetical protein N7470_000544 [Penicillium chermesinum]